jgi:hypothetical protein
MDAAITEPSAEAAAILATVDPTERPVRSWLMASVLYDLACR